MFQPINSPSTAVMHIDERMGAIIMFDSCYGANFIPNSIEIDTIRGNTAEQAIPYPIDPTKAAALYAPDSCKMTQITEHRSTKVSENLSFKLLFMVRAAAIKRAKVLVDQNSVV